jgi:polysaccharide biosynthesis/export protein
MTNRCNSRVPALLLLALTLGGCAVVPGIRMDAEADRDAWTPAGEPPADFVPEIVTINADLLLAQRRAQLAASRPAAPAPAPAATTPAAGGWAVQVGSFSRPGNAEELRRRLASGGFDAFITTTTTEVGTMHRVRVGPEADPAAAERLLARLNAAGHAGGRVERVEPGTLPAHDAPAERYQYRVGPGDVLNVVVWGHPELSNPMAQTQNIEDQARLVREDGTIFFPFLGVVPVAGQTVEEIRARIAGDLDRFVTDPQVDVRVVTFRSQKVYVTGSVRQPGILPITDQPLTVLDAINQAGGFDELADRRTAVITRGDREMRLDILALYASGRGNALLENEDVLFIPDNHNNRVFIMGETVRQRSVPLHEGRLSLAEALTEAEGLYLGVADTRSIFVLRGREVFDADRTLRGIRPEVYHLDARSGTALLLAEGFQLEPRDIVYVASTGVVRFNRVIQQILPTVQTIWQTDRIIND